MPEPILPRVLTMRGAERIGMTEGRVRTELRNGHWRRLATGILLTRPDEPTREDWIEAGLVLGGAGSAVTAWDALRLQGLRTDAAPTHLVRVLTRRGRNRVVGSLRLCPSTRAVRISPVSTETLRDIPTVNAARAIADAALDYRRFEPVRALVTHAIQRRRCTVDELSRELAAAPRNGSAHLRRALHDIAGGAESIAEAEAVDLLRRRDIPPFEVNAPIVGAGGRLVAVVDVLWPELRAVLEIDSREFHFGEDEWKETMRRHNELMRCGFAVAHYPPSDIRRRRSAWVDEIAAWLRARARELDLP